jgi:hypothetical protein
VTDRKTFDDRQLDAILERLDALRNELQTATFRIAEPSRVHEIEHHGAYRPRAQEHLGGFRRGVRIVGRHMHDEERVQVEAIGCEVRWKEPAAARLDPGDRLTFFLDAPEQLDG